MDEVLNYSNASENMGEKKESKNILEEVFAGVRANNGLAES